MIDGSIDIDKINSIDSSNMFDTLKNFPKQVSEAIDIGRNAPEFPNKILSNKFAILGMGGSAIGGDLLRSYLSATSGAEHLIVNTIRNYNLPGFVESDTNIIASSYSGGTEETLSSFSEALKRIKNLLCITTGGEIGEIATKNNVPIINIPEGFQPRCAIGYSFFPMLLSIMKTQMVNVEAVVETEKALEELQTLIDTRAKEYSDFNIQTNQALKIASDIMGTVPVIYSSCDIMDSVNTRWVRQIQENAKHLAFGGFLPEMNHNEINSWNNPVDMTQKFSLIFIQDPQYHPRVQKRFKALQDLISDNVQQIVNIQSDAKYLLTRMFDMIYLGDWISYYMAILNNVDPTPIPLITKLKELLAQQ